MKREFVILILLSQSKYDVCGGRGAVMERRMEVEVWLYGAWMSIIDWQHYDPFISLIVVAWLSVLFYFF